MEWIQWWFSRWYCRPKWPLLVSLPNISCCCQQPWWGCSLVLCLWPLLAHFLEDDRQWMSCAWYGVASWDIQSNGIWIVLLNQWLPPLDTQTCRRCFLLKIMPLSAELLLWLPLCQPTLSSNQCTQWCTFSIIMVDQLAQWNPCPTCQMALRPLDVVGAFHPWVWVFPSFNTDHI